MSYKVDKKLKISSTEIRIGNDYKEIVCLSSTEQLYYIIDLKVSEVGDFSREWPEGSLFNSYYTVV